MRAPLGVSVTCTNILLVHYIIYHIRLQSPQMCHQKRAWWWVVRAVNHHVGVALRFDLMDNNDFESSIGVLGPYLSFYH